MARNTGFLAAEINIAAIREQAALLAESWVNGNRSDVILAIGCEPSTMAAASLAVDVAMLLNDGDRSEFCSRLESRSVED